MQALARISMRSVLWLAFFAGILLAWWTLYSMSISMNMDLFGRSVMINPESGSMTSNITIGLDTGMDMPMVTFAPLFGMWAIMMAAMMLPTMVPTLTSYEDLMVSADGTHAGWLGVILGYMTVWIVFAAFISAVQLGLLASNIVDMIGAATSVWLSVVLLMATGAYQFTRIKEVCHGACRSPMMYFIGHWKIGFFGGLRMGFGLGAFCVGCCALFMALGFVGGVMNFLWMGLATLFMVVEKLPQIGHRVTRPMGGLLIIAGIGLAVSTC
jgi:predicted metal-binding membrane protein